MSASYTVFSDGQRVLARGTDLAAIARRVREALRAGEARSVLVFDDATGRVVDLDEREAPPAPPPGPGRPRLGVVSREVSLLPRHWEWLQRQSGGASAALRRLVEDQSKHRSPREAQESAYRFMGALAGDLPGFEEAARSLFAGRSSELAERMADWPEDVRRYALSLVQASET